MLCRVEYGMVSNKTNNMMAYVLISALAVVIGIYISDVMLLNMIDKMIEDSDRL